MSLAKIGFGCYRVDYRIEEHYKSLYRAITNGIDIIDTSSNYSDGGSEILVGNVITDLINEKKINREEITIITKAGYIQGSNYKSAVERKKSGSSFSDIVEYSDGLWHCISPDFLENQLLQQLVRLKQKKGTGYIDGYLLHNPEYFFGWATKSSDFISPEHIQNEFYHRVQKAFEFLENNVKKGIIRYYGISSNTFPNPSDSSDFISLETVTEIAEKISSGHHFRYIQFPLNLFEPGAYLEKNQKNNSITLLETALKKKLFTLVNRPLNAIIPKGLIRLAEFNTDGYTEELLKDKMLFFQYFEEDFLNEKLPLFFNTSSVNKLKDVIVFSKLIKENLNNFGSIEHLNNINENYFTPRINYLIEIFHSNTSDKFPDELTAHFNNYLKELYILINLLSRKYKEKANRRNKYITGIINDNINAGFQNLKLSQKAIQTIRSIEGVNCVLTGARRLKYTEEIKELNEVKEFSNPGKILKKLKSNIIDTFKN